jgi:hypothetical protein
VYVPLAGKLKVFLADDDGKEIVVDLLTRSSTSARWRFRLFFRYGSKARVMVFAWVNDESQSRGNNGRNTE